MIYFWQLCFFLLSFSVAIRMKENKNLNGLVLMFMMVVYPQKCKVSVLKNLFDVFHVPHVKGK